MNFFPPLLSSLLLVCCISSHGASLDLLHGNEGTYWAQGLGEHINSGRQLIVEGGEGLFSIVCQMDNNFLWLKGKFVRCKKTPFSFVLRCDEIEKYFKTPDLAKDENGLMVRRVSFQIDLDGKPHPFSEQLHNFKSCHQFKFIDKKLTAFRIQYLDDEGVTHRFEVTDLRLPGSDRKIDWDF